MRHERANGAERSRSGPIAFQAGNRLAVGKMMMMRAVASLATTQAEWGGGESVTLRPFVVLSASRSPGPFWE